MLSFNSRWKLLGVAHLGKLLLGDNKQDFEKMLNENVKNGLGNIIHSDGLLLRLVNNRYDIIET